MSTGIRHPRCKASTIGCHHAALNGATSYYAALCGGTVYTNRKADVALRLLSNRKERRANVVVNTWVDNVADKVSKLHSQEATDSGAGPPSFSLRIEQL